MENDSIRPSGTNTLVDIWIEGKVRSICVAQEAIGSFLGFDQAAGMSDRDRCEFVRAHLPLVAKSAKARLAGADAAANSVTIGIGDLPRPDGSSGDRRKANRRSNERRKPERPASVPIERRRRERRQSERRTKPAKSD
jgi:hypothetical protein